MTEEQLRAALKALADLGLVVAEPWRLNPVPLRRRWKPIRHEDVIKRFNKKQQQ